MQNQPCKTNSLAEANIIDPVIKVGNLESMRTIADVRDAVRAYYLLVTKNPIGGEYYNIGGSYSCKIKDILDDLISLSTIKDQIKVKEDPNRLRPIDADLGVPDTTKFTNHTGWKPEIPYKETILDLLNYWREKVRKYNGGFLIR